MMSDSQNAFVKIGRISSAHGIKGQVKIRFDGDDLSLLSHPEGVYIGKCDERHHIQVLKTTDKGLICSVKGIEERNAAEKLTKKDIYLERSKFPEINSQDQDDEDQYYITDLVGLAVKGQDGTDYGQINMVDNFGAGDLLSISLPDGGSFYLPFTHQHVLKVDFKSGQIIIAAPNGYLETDG